MTYVIIIASVVFFICMALLELYSRRFHDAFTQKQFALLCIAWTVCAIVLYWYLQDRPHSHPHQEDHHHSDHYSREHSDDDHVHRPPTPENFRLVD